MKNTTAIKASVIIILILVLSSKIKVNAQYDAMFTQYANNEMFINPAFTGTKEALSITALHRQQWVGFDGRPITTTLSIHSPIWENKMGLGLSVLNEEIGVATRNIIYLNYSYRIKTGKKSYLGFGLSGGIHIQRVDFTKVETDITNDPNYKETLHANTPNFGFGINYYTDKFFAGISIPRLLDDNYSMKASFKAKSFHYYIVVGGIISVVNDFKLKPSLMVQAVANAPIKFDLTLNSLIKEKLWLGVSYRNSNDISAIVGLQISPRFLVSYSYDFCTSKLKTFNSGSHELVLSALFGYKGRKIVSTRYF